MLLRDAPPELDIVIPARREGIAPLLRRYEPDVFICVGFPWKIPPDALARAQARQRSTAIPSLLPRYRGPSPVSWAIRNGETEIGYTWHRMDAELDTGPILAQGSVTLEDEHSWEELEPKLVPVVVELLTDALARVEAGDPGDPQERGAGDYFPFFGDDYAWIDPSSSRAEVYRQVKAWRFASATDGLRGALAELDGETVRVLRTSLEPGGGPRDGVRRRHTLDRGERARMRPVIGITSYAQDARWGVWHLPAALVPLAYVDAIERAGGRALVIPPAEDGRRGDARRARRDRLLGRCRRRSGTLRGRGPSRRRTRRRRVATRARWRCCRRRSSVTCRRSRSAVASSC